MTKNKISKKNDMQEKREYHSSSCGIFFEIKDLLYSADSPYQRIEVFQNRYFGNVLLLDGLVQTTVRDEFFYHEMLVHPALVTQPNPENLLIIGGGDGGTLKEILRYPIKHAYLVEIDPQVIEVAKEHIPWLNSALGDKRSELVVADGKEFIKETDKKFDVILIDSSDPVGPSSSLHEKDFYEMLKNCLSPEGIVTAQIGSPFYHLDSIRKKASFLKELYREVHFYTGLVPTYPGGNWCYVFLSDEVNPLSIKRDPSNNLKYYNLDIHRAAFVLPNFMKDKLNKS